MKADEAAWIAAVLEGNSEAFRHLVARYQQMAFSLALQITNHREDAEDVVQDALVLAYRNLHQFKGRSKFATWLYRIVWREAWRRKPRQIPPAQLPDIPDLIGRPAEENLEQAERVKVLKAFLQKLPPHERLALDLYYYHDLSVKEIAEVSSLNLSHVKVLLHRGRKRLADLIPARWAQHFLEA